MARPYQSFMYGKRIDGIIWVEGRSDLYAKRADTGRFFFANSNRIYSDKLAQFICDCNTASGGAIIKRLEQRYDRIYIDEIQDMAGYDIDLLHLILKSNIKIVMVGDHRQATFRTNNGPKNKGYAGMAIIKKFAEWKKAGLCNLTYEVETHRCNQAIADFADSIFPDEPKTKSLNLVATGHDGIFLIPSRGVDDYIRQHNPQILRLDSRAKCNGYEAMNFGESKGLTFERVLIFPHKKAKDWLASGNYDHIKGSISKMYVGITRARHSVAFVYDAESPLAGCNKLT